MVSPGHVLVELAGDSIVTFRKDPGMNSIVSGLMSWKTLKTTVELPVQTQAMVSVSPPGSHTALSELTNSKPLADEIVTTGVGVGHASSLPLVPATINT